MAEVLLLGEDKTHAVLLGVLLREVLKESAARGGQTWVIDGLEHALTFLGNEALTGILPGLRYTSTLQRFEPVGPLGRPLKLRGHIDGKPAGPEATKWRKVFLAVLLEGQEPEAILVAKDTDGDESKLAGLRLVVAQQNEQNPGRPVVVAAPHQDAEAWLVAGFEATNDEEKKRLEGLSTKLSINPTLEPEKLTAHPNDAPRDAKRVLRQLLDLGDESRPLSPEELREHHERLLCDLPRLRRRGERTGLREFLDALQEALAPLWGPGGSGGSGG